MSKQLIALIAVALTIALIGAGCGGGSDGSDGTGSAPEEAGDGASSISKAEFLKKADNVCAEGGKEVEAEFQAYLKKNNLEEGKETPAENKAHVVEIAETIAIPGLQQQVKEIRALGAPSGEEAEVEAFIGAVEEALKEGEAEPASLIGATSELFAKADKLAQEYGLKVCGQRK